MGDRGIEGAAWLLRGLRVYLPLKARAWTVASIRVPCVRLRWITWYGKHAVRSVRQVSVGFRVMRCVLKPYNYVCLVDVQWVGETATTIPLLKL